MTKIALVVLGMHRSGTSSVAGTLVHLGATPPLSIMGPKDENPRGFFESERIMELNEEILEACGSRWDDPRPVKLSAMSSAIRQRFNDRARDLIQTEYATADRIVVKDPRICRLYPLWRQALMDCDYSPRMLVPLRPPAEIIASLAYRNAIGPDLAGELWLSHVVAAEHDSRADRRCFFLWQHFLKDWRRTLSAIEIDLGLAFGMDHEIATRTVETFLAPDLQRHHAKALSDIPQSAAIESVWSGLQELIGSPQNTSAIQNLDRTSIRISPPPTGERTQD